MEITTELVQFIVFVFLCGCGFVVIRGYIAIWTSLPFMIQKEQIEALNSKVQSLERVAEHNSDEKEAYRDIVYRVVGQLREIKGEEDGQFDIWAELEEQMQRRKKFKQGNQRPRWILPVEGEK